VFFSLVPSEFSYFSYFRYGEVFLCSFSLVIDVQVTQTFIKLSRVNKTLKVEREVSPHVQV
jgi:hypothetical protein